MRVLEEAAEISCILTGKDVGNAYSERAGRKRIANDQWLNP
jgi:hypothetical protein